MKLLEGHPGAVWKHTGANYVFLWKMLKLHPGENNLPRSVTDHDKQAALTVRWSRSRWFSASREINLKRANVGRPLYHY